MRLPLFKAFSSALFIYLAFLAFIFIKGGYPGISSQVKFDAILIAASFFVSVLFFSQFILPARTMQNRLATFTHLVRYVLGLHGAAIFIENGVIRERKNERISRRPGVLWLDSASAALLRTPVKFTRVVGPGIAFTHRDEYIAGAVDLHIQKEKIGPLENEDSFSTRRKDEDSLSFDARQKRRTQTQAFTRDGIEVVPSILVTFRLDASPGEGRTGFGFRPGSVERAIAGRPINAIPSTDDLEGEDREWLQLPIFLAVNVWRECASKYKLTDLFEQTPDHPGGLRIIQKIINERLENETCHILDELGRELGKEGQCKESAILKKRGLQVKNVTIPYIQFNSGVEEELLQRWKTTWMTRAQREQEHVENLRSEASESARENAMIDFVEGVTQFFDSPLAEDPISGKAILRSLIQGNRQICAGDPQILKIMPNELEQLDEIIEWVEKQP
jgi:hypothetical protein